MMARNRLVACGAALVAWLGFLPVSGVLGQASIKISGEPISIETSDFSFVGGFEGLARREQNRMDPLKGEELDRYHALLGLDTGQIVFANELFAAYRERLAVVNAEEQAMHMEFAAQLRKGREDGNEPSPDEMMRSMAEMERLRAELAAKREEMTKEFFADYTLVLTAEQLEKWPAVERMRRRDRELAPGTFPGEDIDLIAVCREMELGFDPERGSDGPAALEDVLGRYELEIDRLLQARTAVQRDDSAMGQVRGGGGFVVDIDEEKLARWQKDLRDAAMRLRNGQQKYVRQVAELLSVESRAEFERRIERLSYPRVYAESIVESQLEAIGSLDDLDEEQRASMERMRAEYTRARERLDRAWINAIQQDLENGGGATAMPGNVQVFIVADMESEVVKARQARSTLDREWAGRVRGVLRPEQAERIPEPRPTRRGMIMTSVLEIDPETGEEMESITIEVVNPESGEGN